MSWMFLWSPWSTKGKRGAWGGGESGWEEEGEGGEGEGGRGRREEYYHTAHSRRRQLEKIMNARCHYFLVLRGPPLVQARDFAFYVFVQVSVIFGRAQPPGFF